MERKGVGASGWVGREVHRARSQRVTMVFDDRSARHLLPTNVASFAVFVHLLDTNRWIRSKELPFPRWSALVASQTSEPIAAEVVLAHGVVAITARPNRFRGDIAHVQRISITRERGFIVYVSMKTPKIPMELGQRIGVVARCNCGSTLDADRGGSDDNVVDTGRSFADVKSGWSQRSEQITLEVDQHSASHKATGAPASIAVLHGQGQTIASSKSR